MESLKSYFTTEDKIILFVGAMILLPQEIAVVSMLMVLFYAWRHKSLRSSIEVLPGYQILFGFLIFETILSMIYQNWVGAINALGMIVLMLYISWYRIHAKSETFIWLMDMILALSVLIGILTIVLPIVFWSKIPDQLPMHYNAAGMVDNWSDKSSLILLFFVVFMMIGLMSICVYFVKSNMDSKHSTGVEKSSMEIVYPMLIIMNLVIQIMLAYMTFCVAACRPLGIWFLPVFLVGIFAPIVVMVYKSVKMQTPNKVENARFAELEKVQKGVVYRSKVDLWLGGI
jgi:uncharacterized membrane protein